VFDQVAFRGAAGKQRGDVFTMAVEDVEGIDSHGSNGEANEDSLDNCTSTVAEESREELEWFG